MKTTLTVETARRVQVRNEVLCNAEFNGVGRLRTPHHLHALGVPDATMRIPGNREF